MSGDAVARPKADPNRSMREDALVAEIERLRKALVRILGDSFRRSDDAYQLCREIAAEALGCSRPEPMKRLPSSRDAGGFVPYVLLGEEPVDEIGRLRAMVGWLIVWAEEGDAPIVLIEEAERLAHD